MKKCLKGLVLLISLTSLSFSDMYSFKELVKLASNDLGTNIYLDKDIKDYQVEFNIREHQLPGEIYEFLKIVLFEHDMVLSYNNKGKFYTIKKNKSLVEPIVLPELPIPAEADTKKYHSYHIKNVTNEDVIKVMSIFEGVKYTYLPQSDIIAYACIDRIHSSIVRMLKSSDNTVMSKKIKITIFSINRNKLKDIGSDVSAFNYSFDGIFDGIVNAFRSGNQSVFSVKDSFSLGMTLFALEGHGVTKITQNPTILLSNGVPASLKSVLTVPYLESTSTVKENVQTITNNVKYKDVGLQIEINPKIKNNWVYLDLNLISEELVSLDNDKPITQKISYKSSMKVTKGKPLLLTGITKKSVKYEKNGVPFFSSLPYVGAFFKKERNSKDNQNINIMIEVL